MQEKNDDDDDDFYLTIDEQNSNEVNQVYTYTHT